MLFYAIQKIYCSFSNNLTNLGFCMALRVRLILMRVTLIESLHELADVAFLVVNIIPVFRLLYIPTTSRPS